MVGAGDVSNGIQMKSHLARKIMSYNFSAGKAILARGGADFEAPAIGEMGLSKDPAIFWPGIQTQNFRPLIAS